MDTVGEISISNTSIIDLSKEDLETEFNELKKSHTKAISDMEDKNQQIYDLKRQVATATALEKEYQQEIETLQQQNNSGNKQHLETIRNLEEELKSLKSSYNEKVITLEEALLEKETELEFIRNEVKVLSDVRMSTGANNTFVLFEEMDKLKAENFELMTKFENAEENCKEFQSIKEHLEQSLAQLQEQHKELQEHFDLKKEELIEKSNLVESLQEELIFARNELSTMKCKPLNEDARGNSLFAEVDDSRIQLMNQVTTMKTKYDEMRKQKAKYEKSIQQLQLENFKLLQKFKDEHVKKQEDDRMLLRAHEERIKTLEELITSYQKEIKENSLKLEGSKVDYELKFIEDALADKQAEMEELRKLIKKYSLTETMLASKLRDSNAELRKWTTTAKEYEMENETLKKTVENFKKGFESVETNSLEENINDLVIKSNKPMIVIKKTILKERNNLADELQMVNIEKGVKIDTINLTDENYECGQSERKVNFADGTKESRDSNVTNRKRGGKLITRKFLMVPSQNTES